MAESITEGQSELESKPPKDLPVINDQGFFQHDTGDTYDGFFEAKKKDRSVKMHGPGTYTTAEGDIYSGIWENDRLGSNEEVTIIFTDGSRYEGLFKDWCYNGKGRYIYPDGSVLTGDFVDNIPVGRLTLTDPNGHQWLGKADQGFAWLDPVNHFYEMLERSRDLKRLRRSELSARSIVSKIKTVQSVINENQVKVDQGD
ncbi:MORN repeat-containing protein 4-like [Maniola jurtina]|uniref:MORN repeat-containing protein 4-like n=1 Tax=Maniola jurtina TaxID=191418 RepID=UPI001E68C1C9|nr:MORN repeat-containing protein 4-like [Maniola jurtina]XP_045775217.1 MORN repeat-containing protein 4-like [Maniola jurtina]